MKKIILLFLFSISFQVSFAQLLENRIGNGNTTIKGQSPNFNIIKEPVDSKLNKKSTKHKLDNIINIDQYGSKERTYYTYDEHGWLKSKLDSSWNFIKKIWVIGLSEYSRDANGNMTLKIYSEWNNTLNSFQFIERENYDYNSEGKAILYFYSRWDKTQNKFEIDFKRDFAYDSKGNIIKVLYSGWDENLNTYINGQLDSHVFNEHNYTILDQTQNWNPSTNSWENLFKSVYIYDNNEENLLWLKFQWNPTLLKFDSISKIIDTYDSKHNILTRKSWSYEKSGNFWRFSTSFLSEYVFDAKGNQISKTSLQSNSLSEKPANTEKVINKYDSKNSLMSETILKWDADKKDWINNKKTEYLRDSNITLSQLVLPFDNFVKSYFFKTKLTREIEYSWGTIDLIWFIKNNSTYNYSDFKGLETYQISFDPEILIFPNPVIDRVYFKIQNHSSKIEVKITNMDGKVVLVESLQNKGFINVSAIEKGIYFIQVFENENLFATRKLVKN